MREKADLGGVPYVLGALLAISGILCLLFYWPLIIVPGLVFLCCKVMTLCMGPYWLDILWNHIKYRRHYEG
jgi:hypothetical protein